MRFKRSIADMTQILMTSADPEGTLETIRNSGIELRKISQINTLTYSFWISSHCVESLKTLCKHLGASCTPGKNRGLYSLISRFAARPVLLFGGSILIVLALWLPTRVLFVQVEGNHAVPSRKILESAEASGIGFGASRREVRSEKVKNALLAEVPELEWAGVNTSGCTAVISVRERSDPVPEQPSKEFSSIAAARDGYLLSCTVTKGNLLVQPGQSVREGQILISAYTDCGLSIRVQRAEGDILAQTNRILQSITPSEYLEKGRITRVRRKFSLLFRKKRIILWKDSGIWDGTCGRMYSEYHLTLPGGFQLPLALCIEQYALCPTVPAEAGEDQVRQMLSTFAERYLCQKMIAGRILRKTQALIHETGRYRLIGDYACIEMIGRRRQEQIGEMNGKND